MSRLIDLNVTGSGKKLPCRVCKRPTAGRARIELVFMPLCLPHRTAEVVLRLFAADMKRDQT